MNLLNFQQETICGSMHTDDERWEVDDDNAILKPSETLAGLYWSGWTKLDVLISHTREKHKW